MGISADMPPFMSEPLPGNMISADFESDGDD